VLIPLISTIERVSADGAMVTRFMMREIRPWSPCWIVATGEGRLVVGDAKNDRVLLLDSLARRVASWPLVRVRDQVGCARPEKGWLLMDKEERTISWYGREGVYEGTQRLPRRYEAVVMPEEERLWLFDTGAWVWHEYRAIE
ncbi:MAG: hypothetical protein N2595_09010, partial [bacterium]|nr:hypothetical protein [bacterium]